MKPSFTIGIEEEYQTVDPITRDLRSHIRHRDCSSTASCSSTSSVKAEMHQSVVEVGTQHLPDQSKRPAKISSISAGEMIKPRQ